MPDDEPALFEIELFLECLFNFIVNVVCCIFQRQKIH